MAQKYDHEADWQPISDGLMPDEGLYFITWEGTFEGISEIKGRWIEMAEYYIPEGEEEGKWSLDHIAIRGFKDINVIAWMDLPEKWEGD